MAGKDKNTADIQEAEIIKAPVAQDYSPRAVTVSPNVLRKQMVRDQEMRQVIDEYIKNNMVSGKDYGTINIKGKQSKPSLLKPGAEKFCGLFKIRPTFRQDLETLEMLGNTPGILAYVCDLVDSRGQVVGEGRGVAKTDPVHGSDFDINKQVKIAEKRAQIDAVLRAGGLSDFFTQDMEDAPAAGSAQFENDDAPATDKQRALIIRKLNEIDITTPETQREYLISHFGVEVPLTKKGAGFVIGKLLGN
jgi:hypothetical protein